MFAQQLVNGLVVGAVYALIALGYTLVYGILQLINFAHGEIYMIGAYVGIAVLTVLGSMGLTQTSLGLSIVLVFLIPMIYCAAYGITLERVAYRPLRNAPRLSPLISAIGMSLFLQNYVQVVQGARDKAFPNLLELGSFQLFGAYVNGLQIFILILTLGLMAALQLFIKKTKLGKAMRATAQDRTMASLVGVNVNRVIAATFVHRLRSGRRGRRDSGDVLRNREPQHRLRGGDEGVHRRRSGGHRQRDGSVPGRLSAGASGEFLGGIRLRGI